MLLALALVFAQSGAVVHAYSHLTAPSEPARSTQSCGDCLAYSPLLTAAGGTNHFFALMPVSAGTSYRPPVAPVVGQPTSNAFRARAPPFLA